MTGISENEKIFDKNLKQSFNKLFEDMTVPKNNCEIEVVSHCQEKELDRDPRNITLLTKFNEFMEKSERGSSNSLNFLLIILSKKVKCYLDSFDFFRIFSEPYSNFHEMSKTLSVSKTVLFGMVRYFLEDQDYPYHVLEFLIFYLTCVTSKIQESSILEDKINQLKKFRFKDFSNVNE